MFHRLAKCFQASGLNSHFNTDMHVPFTDYIEKSQHMISQARLDLDNDNQHYIIASNSPKEYKPTHQSSRKPRGILLIHGLFDSPYQLSSIFNYFSGKDILLRSVLLPGHGTRPGDLLHVHWRDWLKATDYAIHSFTDQVSHLTVIASSTGASLAMYHALNHHTINALVLFAPLIQIKNRMSVLSNVHKIASWAIPRAKWYRLTEEKDYARYYSFPYNAVTQARSLSAALRQALKKHSLDIPLFMVSTSDDEVVSHQAIQDVFSRQTNPLNQLIVYGNHPETINKPNINIIPSRNLDDHILNYSHVCLTVAPDDLHYGKHGDFVDFTHYHNPLARYLSPTQQPIYFGAANVTNLRQYHLARLRYNPDFYRMMQAIDDFLKVAI